MTRKRHVHSASMFATLLAVALTATVARPAQATTDRVIIAKVTGENVRLRGETPFILNDSELALLPKGTLVSIEGHELGIHDSGLGIGVWMRATVIESGAKGLIAGRYVDVVRIVPVVAAVVPPAPVSKVSQWRDRAGQMYEWLLNKAARHLDLWVNLYAMIGLMITAAFWWRDRWWPRRTVEPSSENIRSFEAARAKHEEAQQSLGTFGDSASGAWFLPEARRRRA